MPKKLNDFKLDYQQTVIDVDKIKPSPFQVRKFFDVDKKKELAGSIQRDGVIQPIVVRFKNGHPEIIAGGRRVQAILEFTKIKSVRPGLSRQATFKRDELPLLKTFNVKILLRLRGLKPSWSSWMPN